MERLARVFRDGDSIDERVGPFYCNRTGQVGLVVSAWNAGQWLQIFSPGTPDHLRDDTFAELEERIRADRTFAPHL